MHRTTDHGRPIFPATLAVFGFLAGVMVHAARPLEVFSARLGGVTESAMSPSAPLGTGSAEGLLQLVVLAALGGVGLLLTRGSRAMSVGVFLLAAILGVLRFETTLPTQFDDLVGQSGSAVILIGRVADVRQYAAVLAVESVDGRPARTRSRVAFAPGRRREIGERVSVACKLAARDQNQAAIFEARQGIFVHCRGASQVTRLSGPAPWNAAAFLARWRAVLTRRIQSVLPGDEGALLAGILYGDRGLSREANAAFRSAGLTHLIAVSGSNITLVAGLLVPLFLLFGYRRKTAIVLAGAGLLAFVLFVGAQASVVRAAVMGWLALMARVFGRKAEATRLLAVAAFVIVVFDPWALAFDAGFALSFLATWGLLAWARPLLERLRWIPTTCGLREAAATTLAATFVTTPYTLWMFERASLSGLVTNLFAIPLVGFSMLWGAVAAAFAPKAHWVALPAEGSLRLMLEIAFAAERVPWLRLSFAFPTWGLFFTYGVFIAVWLRNRAAKSVYPHVARPESKK